MLRIQAPAARSEHARSLRSPLGNLDAVHEFAGHAGAAGFLTRNAPAITPLSYCIILRKSANLIIFVCLCC